jgi:hypothetical protein
MFEIVDDNFEYACDEGIAILNGLQFTLCAHVPIYTYVFSTFLYFLINHMDDFTYV